ncbi:beta-phosphoglucomutase [Solitalea sp. MAHUQ-68]|uniref:Beta-phosphoglucomutase n=1 Tax=Solitalea agri TaxID=2953739 RepID=A0A9X2JBH8_9SPHI|nr:beta-phosphoglucomutase [Solitalea agri]MCO4291459.1 beta-phosphoglucomutase [Solitalea agri]
MKELKACIFDLDGVIVDTAVHHYKAWKRLANSLGFDFTEEQNEQLKGVSRVRSLEIILAIGGYSATATEQEKMAAQKNDWYLELIGQMTPEDILPGAKEFVEACKAEGIKTAIGSASKNTLTILSKIGLDKHFDAIVDGNKVTKAKPDPEVFLNAAKELNVDASVCVVFEDAIAGVEAANNAGMRCVGIGQPAVLTEANAVVSSLAEITLSKVKYL